jgi:hypothetical protein
MLNEYSRIIKFYFKFIEEIFVGYSMTSKVYKIYILSSHIVVEFIYVKFNENTNKEVEKSIKIISAKVSQVDDDETTLVQEDPVQTLVQENPLNEEQTVMEDEASVPPEF